MLNSLRKGAATWVAKIFMGLLVLSFAVWGIADIFRGYGQHVLATVGETEIPPEEFERVLQRQIRSLSAQFGQQISIEQARAFGLDRQVLNSLITNAAIDQQAADLRLGISDQNLLDEIMKIPAFQGSDGKFSRSQFVEILRNNNLSDGMFLREQRQAAVREQLVSALTGDVVVPNAMLGALNQYDNETRVLDYFILPRKAVGAIADPDEETQKNFLQNNPQNFTAPEYRKVGLLTLSLVTVEKSIAITDDEIAADYQARIDQFTKPGKRHILRMSFIDRSKADAAEKELDAGADFMKVAEKFGFKKNGVDMGFVDKSALLDPAVANAAFSMKEGEISQPLQGNLSTVIIKVLKIDPNSVTQKLEDVKDQIKAYLLQERASEKIANTQDTIEDERASGQSLADIAKTMGLSYRVADAIDRQGRGMDGKPVADFPTDQQLFSAIYQSDVGVENDPVESGNDTIYWFDVLGITPARVKNLDEVKDLVIKAWKDRETETRLSKLASEILVQLRQGKPLEQFAKQYKTDVKKTKPFKRSEEHNDIPPAAVNQAFVLPVGGYGMNSLPEGKGRVLFKLASKQNAAAMTDEIRKKLGDQLRAQIENDLISQYITGLRNIYGVSVNQRVLQRLTGANQ